MLLRVLCTRSRQRFEKCENAYVCGCVCATAADAGSGKKGKSNEMRCGSGKKCVCMSVLLQWKKILVSVTSFSAFSFVFHSFRF